MFHRRIIWINGDQHFKKRFVVVCTVNLQSYESDFEGNSLNYNNQLLKPITFMVPTLRDITASMFHNDV